MGVNQRNTEEGSDVSHDQKKNSRQRPQVSSKQEKSFRASRISDDL